MKIPHPRPRERLLFAFIGSHLYSSQQYSSQFQENKNLRLNQIEKKKCKFIWGKTHKTIKFVHLEKV